MAIELYNDGKHKCIAFEDLVTCESLARANPDNIDKSCDTIQSNQFLIVNNGHGVILDPGGNLTYSRLFMRASEHVVIRELDYVIASHQDPDIVGSLNKWLVGSTCKVLVPKLWERFVPHFCSPGATIGRLFGIPDGGMNIQLGKSYISAVPAHFLHSEGNFHFYDPISKILFTGDMGASHVEDNKLRQPVKDFDKHIPNMIGFHQRYMNGNKACRLWANMVRTLDVEWLVPQHGPSFKGKAMVNRFLSWIENLECGIDLMTPQHYQAHGLPFLAKNYFDATA